jgi:hypothetical protein
VTTIQTVWYTPRRHAVAEADGSLLRYLADYYARVDHPDLYLEAFEALGAERMAAQELTEDWSHGDDAHLTLEAAEAHVADEMNDRSVVWPITLDLLTGVLTASAPAWRAQVERARQAPDVADVPEGEPLDTAAFENTYARRHGRNTDRRDEGTDA